ncbi:hypothetical protein S7711_04582 [Stachybotrys chartarum IBT 7711]|uniref:GST N-terminal domain-containing protein n=1 Tax=Stachybotrys chartarum (strain CBS 109288 / IBT 7711) TaxID=1280523 RepID=A0A084APV2_STACB|nr:hypothetical protein S7711_04582 [Stachybotrys chartarum IBT 7711]KFA52833.1 hypothetical protein S40293_00919 [Stachybotrys chartarum IBT 40293]KFA75328.1 hypothetical protein S40288_00259 [Stachybotrys chartarum IBT 40288]
MSNGNEATVKLYWLNQSRAESLVWLLEELKISYEVETFRRTESFLAPPELKRIHPLGKSPVISVTAPGLSEPVVLAESGCIVQYLCDHWEEGRRLVPRRWKSGMEGRIGGETEEWLRHQYLLHYREGTLMPIITMSLVIGRLKSPMVPFLVRPITTSVANRIFGAFVHPNARKNLAMLNQMLETSSGTYLCGNSLTAADILIAYPLIAGKELLDTTGEFEGGSWTREFPLLGKYTENMMVEEGYRKSQEKVKELDQQSKASL